MKQFHDLFNHILDHGTYEPDDRTGVGTYSVFGYQMRFDLSQGEFPLVTSRKIFTRGAIEELLWFLRGSTDNDELTARDVHFWTPWAVSITETLTIEQRDSILWAQLANQHHAAEATRLMTTIKANRAGATDEEIHEGLDESDIPRTRPHSRNGELGPVYGAMWRAFPGRLLTNTGSYDSPWQPAEFDSDGVCWHEPGDSGLVGTKFETIDQIADLIARLRRPDKTRRSRRHVISAWHPGYLPVEGVSHAENVLAGLQVLPPCHCLFQFNVQVMAPLDRVRWVQIFRPEEAERVNDQVMAEIREGKFKRTTEKESDDALIARNTELHLAVDGVPTERLSCMLTQRSLDAPIGGPINTASYALLTMMIAQVVGMAVGEFVHSIGDAHIYSNTVDAVREQLSREPRPLPRMRLNPAIKEIDDFKLEDFTLEGYDPHPAIKFDVVV